MAYDPTSRRLLPIKHLRELIARSAAFQTWTSAVDTAAARAFVHYEELTDPGNVTLPFAIVGLGEPPDSEMIALEDHELRGHVVVRFLGSIVEADDIDKQMFVFGDTVSNIVEEMVSDALTYGFRFTDGGVMSEVLLASKEDRKTRGAYAFVEVNFGFWD